MTGIRTRRMRRCTRPSSRASRASTSVLTRSAARQKATRLRCLAASTPSAIARVPSRVLCESWLTGRNQKGKLLPEVHEDGRRCRSSAPHARGGRRGSSSPLRYKRRTADDDAAVAEAYVNGVSTRKMAAVTKALMGEEISRSAVSRVTKRLDAEVEALRSAKIEGAFPYLYLDATFLDTRWARKVENVSALVAYGVGMDGMRTLLGVTIGAEESEESWAELLGQLLDRGLSGVQLVIADGHRGLANAVRRLLPEMKLQRCVVHSSAMCSRRRHSGFLHVLRRRSRRSSRRPRGPRRRSESTSSRPASASWCRRRSSASSRASTRRPSTSIP